MYLNNFINKGHWGLHKVVIDRNNLQDQYKVSFDKNDLNGANKNHLIKESSNMNILSTDKFNKNKSKLIKNDLNKKINMNL